MSSGLKIMLCQFFQLSKCIIFLINYFIYNNRRVFTILICQLQSFNLKRSPLKEWKLDFIVDIFVGLLFIFPIVEPRDGQLNLELRELEKVSNMRNTCSLKRCINLKPKQTTFVSYLTYLNC